MAWRDHSKNRRKHHAELTWKCNWHSVAASSTSRPPGAATFRAQLGSLHMNTFVKVLIFAAVALAVLHFWPIAVFPLLAVAGAVLLPGGLLAGGAAVVISALVSVLGALLGVLCVVAAVLSPIWIPVLLIVGLVSLLTRKRRAVA